MLALPSSGAAAASPTTTAVDVAPSVSADMPRGELPPRRTEQAVVARFLADPRVARWLERYPPRPETEAEFDAKTRRWQVKVWSGKAGQIAAGSVEDRSARVRDAWVGPQVAWKMARGHPGAFGGRTLTSWPVWLGLSLVFLVGLANLQRPLALRNLDLLALVGFGVPLALFNEGRVFASMALAAPLLAYLLVRMASIGFRPRPSSTARAVWPVWLLIAVTVFLVGLRIGLNVQSPKTVIDVGYAGVIGADRILDGRAPYGHMPQAGARTPCGPTNASGEVRDRIQTDGSCEGSNPHGDTYGPVSYLAYVPAVAVIGWEGRWDALPAAHASSIGFDLLALVGLVLLGRRLGGSRLAATLAFAWVSYPFTSYALLSNTNDSLMPALLVWGMLGVTSPAARGAFSALAGWTKLAALAVVPLWLTYPDGLSWRRALTFGAAFGAVTVAAFSLLLLEPSLGDAVRTFWDRSIRYQLERESPFSIWGWGQYHAEGIPDLAWAQRLVQVGAIVLAGVAAVLPRRKTPLELAALTAAILLAVQLSLTHWFFLYLPWVLPFVVLALLLPRERPPA